MVLFRGGSGEMFGNLVMLSYSSTVVEVLVLNARLVQFHRAFARDRFDRQRDMGEKRSHEYCVGAFLQLYRSYLRRSVQHFVGEIARSDSLIGDRCMNR